LILPPIHEIQKKGKLDIHEKNMIDLAEKNSVRLLRLVNQILDFNKLENDTLHIKVTSVEMVSFCREVFSLFEDSAQRHNIIFDFISNEKSCNVWIDAEKFETVLFNLLSNAFKFTPNSGKITVELSINKNEQSFGEGAFIMQITDTGIGISPEDKPKIFERFYQSKTSRNKDAGSGIGLTLAAEYVNLHHGNINVESTVGKGTTFIVKLPLGRKHFPVDTLLPDIPFSLMATRTVHEVPLGQQTYQLSLKSDKPLVLLVEDNPEMIEFIKTSLGHKYNIVTANNGEEGLIKANNFLPEVIISDIMMPVMDGLTLCKKVKESPRTSYVGIILLTAKSLDSHRVEGIRTGADVYLTKPFEVELLEAHLDQLIARKKELTESFRNELLNQHEQPKKENNQDNKFIKRVMDIIEANISNPDLSVEMISNEMAMSSTHLYRKLKTITDHSANSIIQKYRLKKASLLLQNKEGNISEIMYQVGFSNLSYFSKCFKVAYGMTPKNYQENGFNKS
jgi:DNA-binding response OmpR family regulator